MTSSPVTWGLIAIASLLVAGCTSASTLSTPIVVPARYVSDQMVLPSELEAAYAEMLEADFRHPVFDIETAAKQPMKDRRAALYRKFESLWPPRIDLGLLYIHTFPSRAGEHSNLMLELAEQAGFEITFESRAPESLVRGGPTTYGMQSTRALSVGELAWLADWIFSRAPSVVFYVERENPIINPG